MAKKTKVVVVCDLHSGDVEAVETVRFSWQGDRYSLDVCREHDAELRRTFAALTGKATGNGPARPGRRSAKKAASAPAKARRRARSGRQSKAAGARDRAALRAWARENGFSIGERGRIPNAARTAYEAAVKS